MADGAIVYKVDIDDTGAAKSIDEIGQAANKAGKEGSVSIDGIGGAIKNVVKIIAASAIVKKVLDIGKAAVDAYADYEQLTGGVETLFKESSDTVQEYAANAYKTAGLSANAYMETVTSFSASMIQSLGGDTEQAAQMSNMAITDMADNANKMGTRMEEVQRAYQSMARGNFGMLDSLKLGYGGTRAEMERMLADAEKISGVKYDISNFADVANAIHVIQTEMGITGTTAKEAAETISGSGAMVMASWNNLLVGMVDSTADKTELIAQLFGSIKTYLANLLPAIGSLIQGFIQSLPSILSQILDLAVQLIDDISDNLPTLLENLVQCLASLIQAVIEHIPQILEAGVKLIIGLGQGLIKAIPQLIARVPEIISSLFNALVESVGRMIDAGIRLLFGVEEGAEIGARDVLNWFAGLPGRILGALGDIGSILWNAGANIINGFLNGIKSAFEGVKNFVGGIGSWIAEHKGPEQYDKTLLIKQGEWIMQSLAAGLESGKDDVYAALKGITADISGYSMNLAPVGMGSTTTIVNVNGLTASNQGIVDAGSNLASEIMLDLRMG